MKYYLWINDQHDGPHEKSMIMRFLYDSKITFDTLAHPDDGSSSEWITIEKIPGIKYSIDTLIYHNKIKDEVSNNKSSYFDIVRYSFPKKFVYSVFVKSIENIGGMKILSNNGVHCILTIKTSIGFFASGEAVVSVLSSGMHASVVSVLAYNVSLLAHSENNEYNKNNANAIIEAASKILAVYGEKNQNNLDKYLDQNDEELIAIHEEPPKLIGDSARDELIGKAKFTEKIYQFKIPIDIIGDIVKKHLTESGLNITQRYNEEQIEITAGSGYVGIFDNQAKHSYIVCIAKVGNGVRVSFIRCRAVGALLKQGGWVAATALLNIPVALTTAAVYAGIAASDRNDESLFWSYLDAKIAEIGASHDLDTANNEPTDKTAQIERLWKLKEQGALTQQEFDQQKKSLLC